MGSASRICCKVDWLNGRASGMIGVMRVAPVKVGSLSILLLCRGAGLCVKSWKYRSLASRNYFLPSINRIKTASRVTEDHKALWKARHLLVVTPSIRGKLVGDNGRHRLSIFDCLVEVGYRQAACIVEKTCLIVGWVVSQPAYQCHYPTVVFDGNHISPPFLTRRLRVNDQRFPV